jgi:hypothetical protein
MDDSWPASPRADELSDSISTHAAEIERTLRALEAVEAFRAEAAALRAELHAVNGPPVRQSFRPIAAPELSPGAWRLMVEAGFLVGVAIAAWAFRLHRLPIIAVMGAAWLMVAVIEAIAWRRSQVAYPFATRIVAPPSSPIRREEPFEPAPEPEPEPEEEPAAFTTILPVPLAPEPEVVAEPEPAPEPEPLAAEVEAEPEAEAEQPSEDLESALSPRRVRLPRLRRKREQSPAETA